MGLACPRGEYREACVDAAGQLGSTLCSAPSMMSEAATGSPLKIYL